MKKILLSSVALLGLTAGAMAADLPSRRAPAPIIAAVPVFTWTGFYVGVNAGYGWQNSNDSSVFVPAGTFGPGTPAADHLCDDDGDGFVGGGQIGYNYQFGSFVLGIEADLQWADLGGSNGTRSCRQASRRLRSGWRRLAASTGSARFAPAPAFAFDRALVYATGGFAYGGADDNDGFFSNNDDVRTGWTLGGGVEYAFTNNLTLGLEGL